MANHNTTWTDQMMLDALAMRDRGMSADKIGRVLKVSRSAVLGMFKRVADDLAASEAK
jgi:transcriptional regulator